MIAKKKNSQEVWAFNWPNASEMLEHEKVKNCVTLTIIPFRIEIAIYI